jgi:hypothetical protein
MSAPAPAKKYLPTMADAFSIESAVTVGLFCVLTNHKVVKYVSENTHLHGMALMALHGAILVLILQVLLVAGIIPTGTTSVLGNTLNDRWKQ